jgi:menaquinone-dependent protoporphyrinogen IX oxidase
MGKIVRMTSEEIKAMRAAGGDMTDWEHVRNLTEDFRHDQR